MVVAAKPGMLEVEMTATLPPYCRYTAALGESARREGKGTRVYWVTENDGDWVSIQMRGLEEGISRRGSRGEVLPHFTAKRENVLLENAYQTHMQHLRRLRCPTAAAAARPPGDRP